MTDPQRQPVQVRTIRAEAWRVSDDEIDVTGRLVDDRPAGGPHWWGEDQGATIHDMTLTIRVRYPDLVITGEGRIDAQTAFGKTALGVARRADAAGVPCIAVGGGVEPEGIAALAAVSAVAVPVAERPQSVEAAMSAGVAPVERCGERLARLVSVWLT